MAQPFDENLEIVETDTGQTVQCKKCGEGICDLEDPYKESLVQAIRPVTDANQLLVDPSNYIDDEMEYREYYCPGCGLMIETEIVLADREPVADKELRPDSADE